MKLGDMTFKQIAEICAKYKCGKCPFYKGGIIINCQILQNLPSSQDLGMEVKVDAED